MKGLNTGLKYILNTIFAFILHLLSGMIVAVCNYGICTRGGIFYGKQIKEERKEKKRFSVFILNLLPRSSSGSNPVMDHPCRQLRYIGI